MSKTPINDGLTKYERYRLKDVEAYRIKKREQAKTEEQRKKRREYMKLWREKNNDHSNELARESRKRHPLTEDERLKRNEYQRQWKAKPGNREKHIANVKARYFLRKYGVTLEERDAMIQAQKGLCNICNKQKPLHMDHDHKTGKLRALICMHCNNMLGWAELVGIQNVNRYLKEYA